MFGQTVTFAAQVVNTSPESTADPTGSVQFYVDGTTYGEPVPLDADGAASTADDSLPAGTHQITAGFLPADDNFGPASPRLPRALRSSPSLTRSPPPFRDHQARSRFTASR